MADPTITFDKADQTHAVQYKPRTPEKRDPGDLSRPGKRQRLDPPLMTAAAAVTPADTPSKQRQSTSPIAQTTPNPAARAKSALMGLSQNETSKAPASATTAATGDPATTMSAPMSIVANNIQQPISDEAHTSSDFPAQTSPVSISSIGTLESMGMPSALTTIVGSPSTIDETARQASNAADAVTHQSDSDLKPPTFPASALHPHLSDGNRRGMSLPHSGTRQGTRSPSTKKHRCPYCETEFTRHHNLKSHLLTHSQEKPYVCSTCQSRFRRLHDLKRHTKLHTGERPHTCPRCGRKFARGDALARHNKGPGGCAGRRASMGGFSGDEDFEGGDESMEGVVMYGEPETIEDEEGNERRPGIRRHAPSGDDDEDTDHLSRLPSTYPPIQGRPLGGIASGNFPPRAGYPSTGSGSSSTGGPSLPYPHPSGSSGNRSNAPVGSVFAQNPLTQSPKPLSPGSRQISGPSHDTTRSSGVTSFQPSHGYRSGSGSSFNGHSNVQLPPPHSLNPPDSRFTLPSQAPTHPPTQPSGPPTHMSGGGPLSSQSNSLSSHGHSGHGSGETSSPMFSKDDRIWAYVKSLEQRINSMQDEINGLRSQLQNATQPQQARIA